MPTIETIRLRESVKLTIMSTITIIKVSRYDHAAVRGCRYLSRYDSPTFFSKKIKHFLNKNKPNIPR